MTLQKFIINSLGVSSWGCSKVQKQDGRFYVELEHWSPLGEDVIDCIWFEEKTIESYLKALKEYQENIRQRYEEDAELYISERPRGTEHFSAKELVYDIDHKVEEFNDYVEQAEKLYKKIKGIDDGKKTYYVRFHVDSAIDIKVKASSIEEAKELAQHELGELDDFNKLEWIDTEYTHTEDENGNIID